MIGPDHIAKGSPMQTRIYRMSIGVNFRRANGISQKKISLTHLCFQRLITFSHRLSLNTLQMPLECKLQHSFQCCILRPHLTHTRLTVESPFTEQHGKAQASQSPSALSQCGKLQSTGDDSRPREAVHCETGERKIKGFPMQSPFILLFTVKKFHNECFCSQR